MQLLVCPQEFKGSLTAFEAATAITEGAGRILTDAKIVELPLADGGTHTAEIVAAATGGELITTKVTGPLGDPVNARFALIPGSGNAPPTALIEAAHAAGLLLIPSERRDPGIATSYGVGELIQHALDWKVGTLIVGVGGTATNDGGAGAAQAIGYRLLDRERKSLPTPVGGIHLLNLFALDSSEVDRRLTEIDVRVAVDVTNPLLGEHGATHVYGPQKGITGEMGEILDTALGRWARVVRQDLGVELTDLPGGGAGGGLAAGLIGTIGGQIESGAALVGEIVHLDEAIRDADLVVTGEGKLDEQTTFGKTVAHVLARCTALERPCLVVAGSADQRPSNLSDLAVVASNGITVEEAMTRAPELVAEATERLLLTYMEG